MQLQERNILVLGYGNSLCGDDGLGPRVASLLAQRIPPDLARCTTIQALHQLDITLASAFPTYAAIIFIDAQTQIYQAGVEVVRLDNRVVAGITQTKPLSFSAHFQDPQDLLALTESLYQHCPPAWLVAVRGYQLEIGTGLSPQAEANAQAAVAEVLKLLKELKSERIATSIEC